MPSGLPPLNALRAFEAAARHLSFTRAAEELHVTQAAVSHQIRALERNLGVSLFYRGARGLRLTTEAQDYVPAVRRAFELLREATDRMRRDEARGTLTISLLPSFATRWLVPRLGLFTAAHPEIDVRVAPSTHLVEWAKEQVDVAIRYGAGRYPGLRSDRLMTENIFPVCSPRLLTEGKHPLQAPADLRHHTLLHDEGHGDWRNWLMAAGVGGVDWDRGPIFVDSSMLIQAAVEGQGVALARGVLARDELRAGRLVRPFDLSLPSEYAYYVVCPEAAADRPRVAAFREWLLAQVRLEEALGEPGVLCEPPAAEQSAKPAPAS